MTLQERQNELDIMKWYDSVSKRDDMCGEYIFCDKCNKENNNPYRLYEKLGIDNPTLEEIVLLQEEGKLNPFILEKGAENIELVFSPNSTYLITLVWIFKYT